MSVSTIESCQQDILPPRFHHGSDQAGEMDKLLFLTASELGAACLKIDWVLAKRQIGLGRGEASVQLEIEIDR